MHRVKYIVPMSPKTGRPSTGMKPNFIARVDVAIAASARQAARFSSKRVGVWLEEAILEKIEREDELRRSDSISDPRGGG